MTSETSGCCDVTVSCRWRWAGMASLWLGFCSTMFMLFSRLCVVGGDVERVSGDAMRVKCNGVDVKNVLGE
eukprot:2464457-Amphidinium_carterae.2